MMLIDTHTHLYLPEFESENHGQEAVDRAISAGVKHLIMPNVDKDTLVPMKTLANYMPDKISMAIGLHPTSLTNDWKSEVEFVEEELEKGKYCAIGEVGIDLYWDKTYREAQIQCFDYQLQLAKKYNLPVIIHCREGLEQTLEVLKSHPGVQAVFHSFGGDVDQVESIRKVGDYYFGINGVVTFKNCKVKDSLKNITLERLMLETDAPYLAPVPYRGKRNESAYIVKTAEFIANHLGLPVEEVANHTTSNAEKFFKLGN